MLGHSHATSGALAWSGAAVALPVTALTYPMLQQGHGHLGVTDLLLGTFLTAGAALLPDADHPDGTIAHVYGPLSHAFCRFVAKVSGGHRHATHSFAFVAAVAYGTWAGEHWLGRWFTLGLVFVLLSLAVRALHLCPPGEGVHVWVTVSVLALCGTFAMAHWISEKPAWLPFSVGLGALVHLGGDCLTNHGCRLFWPLPLRTALPLISRTGNRVETWVFAPAFTAGTLALLYYAITRAP
jgi:membrane-bound metal-dependent hydrolase YbcI (DUF457 family)